MNKLQSMQSKTAHFILGTLRREWSRSKGFDELNWLSMPQIAVEASLKIFYKVLRNKKPENVYKSIFNEEEEKVRTIEVDDLKKMTKLSKKSWTVRVLRFHEVMPSFFLDINPESNAFKRSLKSWIKENVPFDGGIIFKGKVKEANEDWLQLEVDEMRKRIEHELESIKEYK